MLFTVFTPTYNRSHLLPRLFESLCNQTVRNFEWLIIDDGSSDDTEKVVALFIEKADFSICYIKQKNQGKHIAINTAVENANGTWYLPMDSDDYIAQNGLEICEKIISETINDDLFDGFTFIRAPEALRDRIQEFGSKRWTEYNSYEWEFAGEMIYVFKMEAIRKYPFPVFEDEKFCQESVQIIPIVLHHKILYTDYILAFGEYLEDGLSQNLYERLLKNPKYALLTFKTKLLVAKTVEEKEMLAKNYWDIVLKTNQSKIKTFRNFPVLLNFLYFRDRILQKIKK